MNKRTEKNNKLLQNKVVKGWKERKKKRSVPVSVVP